MRSDDYPKESLRTIYFPFFLRRESSNVMTQEYVYCVFGKIFDYSKKVKNGSSEKRHTLTSVTEVSLAYHVEM